MHVVLLSPDYIVSCRDKAWRQLGACCSLARALSRSFFTDMTVLAAHHGVHVDKGVRGVHQHTLQRQAERAQGEYDTPDTGILPEIAGAALCNLSLLPIPLLSRLSLKMSCKWSAISWFLRCDSRYACMFASFTCTGEGGGRQGRLQVRVCHLQRLHAQLWLHRHDTCRSGSNPGRHLSGEPLHVGGRPAFCLPGNGAAFLVLGFRGGHPNPGRHKAFLLRGLGCPSPAFGGLGRSTSTEVMPCP